MKRANISRYFSLTRARAWLVLGALVQASGTVALAQEGAEPDVGPPPCVSCGFLKTVTSDTREVVTAPTRWQVPEWKSVAGRALIVAGTMALLDEPVRDYLQNHDSDTGSRIADTFEPFGEKYAAGVLIGYALVGKLADNPKARQTALDGTVSVIITSGLIVPTLKLVAGRSRPRADQGASDFHALSDGASFPSGHAAAAFAIATSIAENDDRPWVDAIAYGVATLVGYSRMEHDAHWLSDVMASAFIGIGTARSVSALNRGHSGLAVVPMHDADGWRIEVSKAF